MSNPEENDGEVYPINIIPPLDNVIEEQAPEFSIIVSEGLHHIFSGHNNQLLTSITLKENSSITIESNTIIQSLHTSGNNSIFIAEESSLRIIEGIVGPHPEVEGGNFEILGANYVV